MLPLPAGLAVIALFSVATLAHQQQPHLVLIIGDDMGSNDVGYSDPQLDTPHMDALAADGVKFGAMYTWNWCAPSRGSLLSGRYAPNHGYLKGGDGPEKGSVAGLPLEFELLPGALKKLGYTTAMVGKWHLGYATDAHLPESRGFDSYLGYLTGAEDYYTHEKSPVPECPTLDFWNGTAGGGGGNGSSAAAGPARIDPRNATYSTDTFARRAVEVIAAHPNTSSSSSSSSSSSGGDDVEGVPPLFLYAAFQGVHGPLEVPKRFFDRVVPPGALSAADLGGYKETCSWANYTKAGSKGFKCDKKGPPGQNCYCNRLVVKAQMLSLDEAIHNITVALKARNLYDDAVIVVMGDNGGPTFEGHSNSPLRGGKLNWWEGGVRPAAFVHAASPTLLPTDGSSHRGGWYNGSLHETDVFATFFALANNNISAAGTPPTFGGFAIDGVNIWGALLDGGGALPPPRTEVLIGDDILRVDEWKLVAYDAKKSSEKTGMLRDCMLGTGGGWLDPPTDDDAHGRHKNLCPLDVYTKHETKKFKTEICCSDADAPGCIVVSDAADKQVHGTRYTSILVITLYN